MKLLLPLCYAPSLRWFRFFLQADEVLLERHENFVKSSFRNRCEVASPNGLLVMSVPVTGGKDHHQLYREVRISEAHNWRKLHWQTLCSCYRRSPYFEYYEAKFEALYAQPQEHLFDFNTALLQLFLQCWKVDKPQLFTETYERSYEGVTDLRPHFGRTELALPGQLARFATEPRYIQCFEARNGFIENLSAFDLLFCEGPRGVDLLRT